MFTRLTAVMTTGLLLSGCAGSAGSAGTETPSAGSSEFSLMINDDNHIVQQELTTLSTGTCKAANSALPFKVQTLPIGEVDQKVELLGGQDALPVQFGAGGTPTLTRQLDRAGRVLDLAKTLKELGAWDSVQPVAVKTVERLYGRFNVMPYQLNIEGIWYNKKLFADHGVSVPRDYRGLMAAAKTFKASGITPFSASGKAGWPITRLISGYLFRDLGAEAMQAVADGKAKLTDPEYVRAAQAVANLGKSGYFSKDLKSIDYDSAVRQFLTGQAAMYYMGSWELSDFNNATMNKIGVDNVGFMPFPTVAGGKGSADEIAANVGLPVAVAAKGYNAKVGDWLACIAKNYGAEALKGQGSISGFVPHGDIGTLPPLTRLVQDTISKTTTSVLWFEAMFNAKATQTSLADAVSLADGSMAAQEFMAKVQADLDNG